jgi:hypothetical protein
LLAIMLLHLTTRLPGLSVANPAMRNAVTLLP